MGQLQIAVGVSGGPKVPKGQQRFAGGPCPPVYDCAFRESRRDDSKQTAYLV